MVIYDNYDNLWSHCARQRIPRTKSDGDGTLVLEPRKDWNISVNVE